MRKMWVVILIGLAVPVIMQAQDQSNGLDSAIESMRADLRADKVAIVGEAMHFTDAEAKIFWPVYRAYEADMTKVNDQRVTLVRSYADKFATMTDADASQLTDRALDFEAQRAALHKKYVAQFRKAGLSPTTVAKFMQLEHRLDLLVDLKLASELPALLIKAPAPATK